MFCFSKPTQTSVNGFLALQRTKTFSYPEVGASRHAAPPGYNVDHNRIQLGAGRSDFELAKTAIRQWKMFDIPGIELCWPDAQIEAGSVVAVRASHLGFWSLNACRIVYVLDEMGPAEKFGFAYGTLQSHAERGEERFSVEFHPSDESVWYDIFAFSRPNLLAAAGYPIARAIQRRFARESMAAMRRAINTCAIRL